MFLLIAMLVVIVCILLRLSQLREIEVQTPVCGVETISVGYHVAALSLRHSVDSYHISQDPEPRPGKNTMTRDTSHIANSAHHHRDECFLSTHFLCDCVDVPANESVN